MVISSSIAVSIGYTFGKKNTQQEANNRIPVAHFSEQQVNDFLRSYFTFTEYGDNYLNYEKFLAKQAKIAEEESRKQSDFFPQFFGHSRFIKSKNFIRHVNDQKIEVIANVTRTIDSLNQEGKSTKTLENEGLFQIWYVFDSATKHFLVERYKPLEIAEKESKEYAE